MRDELELFDSVAQVEPLAGEVKDSGGVYVVPAFSGLFAPRWRPDARGVVTGLTAYATKAHLVRAALEATCFQTRELVDAMRADTDLELEELRVDGGMVANGLLMQLQADVLGVRVTRAAIAETTAYGACLAAGLAVGVWSGVGELADCRRSGVSWVPDPSSALRTRGWRGWNRAVQRSLDWVEADDVDDERKDAS